MANNWIIDVIADLRSYAEQNDLSALARQLDDAVLVAALEIASQDGGDMSVDGWKFNQIRAVPDAVAKCSSP